MVLIAGMIPLEVKCWARREIWDKRMTRESMDERMKEKWRKEWKREEDGKWGRALFDHCWNEWMIREHGGLSYWMTQVFTVHGCFDIYLWIIGKRSEGNVGHVGNLEMQGI
ncbi:hypothetical protein HHI36_011219 [Cryptolaemus montrouzieri]|uniref:Uncharacterized protein n=1 Tax=Cryptolaemus montrouzieri TaxID=559131 RepID=A0ABD2MLF7_9CUCU